MIRSDFSLGQGWGLLSAVIKDCLASGPGLCSLASEDPNVFPLLPPILNLENRASWGREEGKGLKLEFHISPPRGKFTSASPKYHHPGGGVSPESCLNF